MIPTLITPHILAIQRQINRAVTRDALLRGLLAASLTAVITAATFVCRGFQVDLPWLMLALPVGIITFYFHWFRFRVNPYAAAGRADTLLNLNDSLITAYRAEQDQTSTPFHMLQREQATSLLATRNRAPLTPPYNRPILVCFLLTAGISVALSLLPDSQQNLTKRQQEQSIAAQTQAINAELLAAVSDTTDLTDDVRKLLSQTKIKAVTEKLALTTDLSKALQQYAELEREVRDSLAKTDTRKDEALLGKIASSIENEPLVKAFAESLKKQEYKISADDIEKVRKRTTQNKSAQDLLAHAKNTAQEILKKVQNREKISDAELETLRDLAVDLDMTLAELNFKTITPYSNAIAQQLESSPENLHFPTLTENAQTILDKLNAIEKRRAAIAQAKNRQQKLEQLTKAINRMQEAAKNNDDPSNPSPFSCDLNQLAQLSDKAQRALQKLLENQQLQDSEDSEDSEDGENQPEPLSEDELAELEQQLEELEDDIQKMDKSMGQLSDRLRQLQARKSLQIRLSQLQCQLGKAQGALGQCARGKSPGNQPGSGIGSHAGAKPSAPQNPEGHAQSATPNARLTALKGEGPSTKQLQDAQSGSGTITNPGKSAAQVDFQAQIEALVRREDVPADLKDGVKSYFKTIHQSQQEQPPQPKSTP